MLTTTSSSSSTSPFYQIFLMKFLIFDLSLQNKLKCKFCTYCCMQDNQLVHVEFHISCNCAALLVPFSSADLFLFVRAFTVVAVTPLFSCVCSFVF